MTGRRTASPPTVTWVYGGLGLIPFVIAAGLTVGGSGGMKAFAAMVLLAYGGLILSFLGGGRWGLEVGRNDVRAVVISASMAPTVIAFVLLVAVALPIPVRLAGMALAMVGQWAWDVRSTAPPVWYPPLRHVLTAGAVACLLVGAASTFV